MCGGPSLFLCLVCHGAVAVVDVWVCGCPGGCLDVLVCGCVVCGCVFQELLSPPPSHILPDLDPNTSEALLKGVMDKCRHHFLNGRPFYLPPLGADNGASLADAVRVRRSAAVLCVPGLLSTLLPPRPLLPHRPCSGTKTWPAVANCCAATPGCCS